MKTMKSEHTTYPERITKIPVTMEGFDEQWQDAFLDGLTLAADYPREGQARRVKATMASILEYAYYKYRYN